MRGTRGIRKDWLKQQLREVSTSAGAGAYNTPYAFGAKKNAKGTARDYYLRMGYRLVNNTQLRKNAKGLDYKDLWK